MARTVGEQMNVDNESSMYLLSYLLGLYVIILIGLRCYLPSVVFPYLFKKI